MPSLFLLLCNSTNPKRNMNKYQAKGGIEHGKNTK